MSKPLVVFLLATMAGLAPAHAQMPDLERVGPQIGTAAPPFDAVDQFGRPQTLESLMGREGLMLVFFRSADW